MDQNPDNFLKMTKHEMGCCDGEQRDCLHFGQYTQANSVTVLTIEEDGKSVDLPCVIAANATASAAQTAIKTALTTAGYYEDGDGAAGISVVDAGTTLDISIIGDIKVLTLTASGGTTTFTARCKKQNLCIFAATGFTAGAGSIMKINGADQSLGTITPGTTTAADVKTAVEAALTAEGITSTATVTTTGSGGSQTYNISVVNIPSASTLALVGASGIVLYLVPSNCVQTYTA
ncbi:MAG: hypothetical protein ACRC1D_03385 [Culicoidibacterales bacterium]